MITAHGKTRSYLHRFKIRVPGMPLRKWKPNSDHLQYQCSKLNNEREKLITHISKEDNWPVKENELVNKYLKQFTSFRNSNDYGKL